MVNESVNWRLVLQLHGRQIRPELAFVADEARVLNDVADPDLLACLIIGRVESPPVVVAQS